MLRNKLDIQLRNVCLIFRVYGKASGPSGPPLHPPWNPWNIQLSQGTGQGVSMTFNAANRLRSLEDRSAAPGSSRCELPGMHSVPKSAVLPYASGVGGLSRRLLNLYLQQQPEVWNMAVLRTPSQRKKERQHQSSYINVGPDRALYPLKGALKGPLHQY